MSVLITSDKIPLARLFALKSALKLEVLGIKSRHFSAYKIIKTEFNLKGNKQKVLNDFTLILEGLRNGNI